MLAEILRDYVKNNKITLDKELHFYYDGDVLINAPSVSELVNQKLGKRNFSDVDPTHLQLGIDRGNCLHARIENYVKNGTDWECLCTPAKKVHDTHYQRAKKFVDNLKEQGWELFSEVAIFNGEYVGQIDLIAIKGLNTKVIDFKTSKEPCYERESTQLEYYRRLLIRILNNYVIDGIWYSVNSNCGMWSEIVNVNINKVYDPMVAVLK